MNLDDRLQSSLNRAYAGWEPTAPDAITPRRSLVPAAAGAGVAVVVGSAVVGALVLGRGHTPVASQRVAGSGGSVDTLVQPCRAEDLTLTVTVTHPAPGDTVAPQPAGHTAAPAHVTGTGTTDTLLTALLVPHVGVRCRVYYENQSSRLTGPDGRTRPGSFTCGVETFHRYDAAGAPASPAAAGSGCGPVRTLAADDPNSSERTNPGENDDYGLVLADGAPIPAAASPSLAAEAQKGRRRGAEPEFSSMTVADEGSTGALAPGTWTETVVYGPWHGSASFDVPEVAAG